MSEPASPPRPSAARATGSGSHAYRPAGYLLAAGAATSWGAQTIVAKLLLTSGLPATSLVSTRTALAALILTAATALVRPTLLRVSPQVLWRLALLGIAGMSLSNYTYYLTLSLIPVAMAAILLYMTPLFVLAGGVLFLREPLRRQDVALYFAALARISATHVSVTSTLEPVVSGLVAFAVLGEILAPPQLAGGALVLAGIGLLHLRR